MSNIFYDFHQPDGNKMQKESEYSRILTAAVVNGNFRKLLLSNPGLAMKKGFSGESFQFVAEESSRIAAIKVTTLAEFARQMNANSSRLAVTTPD